MKYIVLNRYVYIHMYICISTLFISMIHAKENKCDKKKRKIKDKYKNIFISG